MSARSLMLVFLLGSGTAIDAAEPNGSNDTPPLKRHRSACPGWQ